MKGTSIIAMGFKPIAMKKPTEKFRSGFPGDKPGTLFYMMKFVISIN
jgi:hypothetical protein